MKIAIIAPSPVPFTIGGAENLWWGLQQHINQHTPHMAELIKLPTRENDFWSLMDSYQQFSELDVSYFDLVISSKYPAWMVKHPNHVCYMQHTLRGLYDCYPIGHLGTDYDSRHPAVAAINRHIDQHWADRAALPVFFELLATLKQVQHEVAPSVFAFPSPFSRRLVHYMDKVGLDGSQITRYYAIADTVKARGEYFPDKTLVTVVHHPSNLPPALEGAFDYFFTVSRLDAPKRLDLLVQAMHSIPHNLPLYIAGTGPEAERLQALAASDPRIVFLGFVTDAEILGYYQHALAVPFLPRDEDYGLITIEAMRAGKPVLTTHDAGGPNEFVRNGITGFSVPPTVAALAEKLAWFAENRQAATLMGKHAQAAVADISWQQVSDALIDNKLPKRYTETLPKITVAITFEIDPPNHGGRVRVFNLYRELAKHAVIEIITMTDSPDATASTHQLAPNLTEIRLPKSHAFHQQERELSKKLGGNLSLSDTAMLFHHALLPDYRQAIATSAADADIVIASHPYTYNILHELHTPKHQKQALWYEAHNVEYMLKKAMYPDNATGQQLLKALFEAEKACAHAAELIMTCTPEDGQALQTLYGVTPDKIITIPNGVDIAHIDYTPWQARQTRHQKLGLEDSLMVFFMASWHAPNLEAIEHLRSLAHDCPQFCFLVIGSACGAFNQHEMPPNLKLAGLVDESTKSKLLATVNIAINPMCSGSGTNLKMLEYLAAGIPTLSTPFGARGLSLTDGETVILANIPEMKTKLLDLATKLQDNAFASTITEQGRQHVCEHFSWTSIADGLVAKLPQAVDKIQS